MELRPTLPLGIFPPFRLRRPPSFLLLGEASSSPFFPNGFSKTYSFIICSPSLFPFSRRIRGMRTLHKIGIPFEQRGVLTHPSFFLSSLFLPTRFPISPLLRHCCHSARVCRPRPLRTARFRGSEGRGGSFVRLVDVSLCLVSRGGDSLHSGGNWLSGRRLPETRRICRRSERLFWLPGAEGAVGLWWNDREISRV